MWLYLIILFIVVYLSFREINGRRLTMRGLIIVLSGLALFVGMGDMLGGYDRYIYAECFDQVADVTKSGDYNYRFTTLWIWQHEYAYFLVNILISIVTKNRYIFILIFTLLVYFNIFQSLKKYTDNYAWAVLVFLGFWFFFTFTYLRQVMAVSVAWYAISYAQQRKIWKFLLVVFLAYQFHNSAILFLVLYFLPMKKLNKWLIVNTFLILLIVGLTGLPSLLFDAYGAYSGEMDRSNLYSVDRGFRYEYLLEVLVLMAFVFYYYDRLYENVRMALMTNMTIFFCFILILFINSSDGGRLSWYFMIGVISTLATIVMMSESKVTKYLIAVLCVGLFIRIVLAWGVLLSPYKTFLTNGIREGDIIEQRYEYDHNYDYNKFYR